MNKMSEKILGRLRVFATIAAVALVAAVATVAAPQEARALTPDGDGVYRISTVAEWKEFADMSRNMDFAGKTVVLDSDLNFEGVFDNVEDSNAYTVGPDEKHPFKGTFNGGDHTISNFRNERDGLRIQTDCGLFGWTDEAVIKNLNVKDSYVGASYRGGMIVGVAQDTFLLNILCENCITSVIPANNVLNLITNAGISGGTIAGVTNGSTLYNCEMRGGRVVTNATAGVAALGGQPLYMGGLVGQANDTVIEYSRVTNAADGTQPEISNTYETAVSVANYSEVFTGGIVGAIQGQDTGTKIVDCYSTAYVHSKAAIYFGVGLGLGVTRGYTGGIVGVIYSGEEDNRGGRNLIERVSFAGTLGSYVYNQVLLGIPAIETNKYLGAIAGLNRNENTTTIKDVYYKNAQTAGEDGDQRSVPAYLSNYAASTVTYGESFGPNTSSYDSRDFWENANFDMAGGVSVDLGNAYEFTTYVNESEWGQDWSTAHYNKWTMDYRNGMPVHGGSIKATMDFPGSGTVTIGETGLAGAGHEQSTNNPYDFAVQGFLPNDRDITVTFAPNDGYQFMGWFRSRGVLVNDIDQNHDLFTEKSEELNTESGLIDPDGKYKLDEMSTTLTVYRPEDEQQPQSGEYSDNDLYVAYVQARVQLHDVEGNELQHDGNGNVGTENARSDWYDYGDAIILPSSLAGSTGTFVGWTTQANGGKGYSSIDSATLAQLRENGLLWEPGSTYTVTSAADLYPVFTTYNNVSVIYEGHGSDIDTRDGYGRAVKGTNPESGDLILSITKDSNGPLALEDPTVRFLGWYEYVGEQTDVNDADADTAATSWLRVSRDETFNVSESGADLTGTHIYKARFEYRVDYWTCGGPKGDVFNSSEWQIYDSIWHTYGQEFVSLTGPMLYEHPFAHWATLQNTDDIDYAGDASDPFLCDDNSHAFSGPITAPQLVFAHHSNDGGSYVMLLTDFPVLVSDLSYSRDGSDYTLNATMKNSGDRFIGWTFERDDHSGNSTFAGKSNPFVFNRLSGITGNRWVGWAYLQARVTFHGIPGQAGSTVYRKNHNSVFRSESLTNTYKWYYGSEADVTDKLNPSVDAPSPTDDSMVRPGYVFLGWLETTDPEVQPIQKKIVTSMPDDSEAFLAVSQDLVAPYLMTGAEVCTRPMDLYPVYAEFKIETTTNIAEAGVDTSTYSVPDDPTLVGAGIEPSAGTITVTYNDGKTVELTHTKLGESNVNVIVDTSKNVWINPPEGTENEPYTFVSLTVYVNGEESETIPASAFKDVEGGKTTNSAISIKAGNSYKFVANYSPIPVAVTYHLNDAGDTDAFVCEVGDPVPGTSETPSFSAFSDSFFYGWVEDTGPVAYSDGIDMVVAGQDTVKGTMDLWPVYRAGNVKVESNIDGVTNGNNRRAVKHEGDETNLWLEADEVSGYTFEGWYKGNELVTEQAQYPLSGEARFDGMTYTAHYSAVHQIRYHGTDNSVIYTASVADGDDRAFVKEITVDVPVLDEDGNLQYDDNGDLITKPQQQTVIIDADAFSTIAQLLEEKSSAPDATVRESFSTWQYIGADGPVRWDFFKESNAYNLAEDGGLDIYPVTWQMSAEDSQKNTYTSNLTWSGDAVENGDGTSEVAQSIRVTFTERYLQPHLDVIVNEASYGVENGPALTGRQGIEVSAYDKDGSAPLSEGVTGNVGENYLGRARLYFDGVLTIQKTLESASSSDQVFYFTVTGSDNAPRTVAVTVKANATTGSTTLKLPYGEYTVAENDAWAWRYDSSIDNGGNVTVSSDATVTCTNKLDGELGTKWFDGSDFIRNTFGEKGGE